MAKKRKRAKPEKFSERLITGLGAAFISAAVLLAVFALLIKNGVLDIDAATFITVAVEIISAFICGMTVTAKGQGNIIKSGLIPGIAFGILITLLSIIISSGAFSIINSLKIMLISAAGSTTGSIAKLCNSNKKCRRQHRT